MISFVRTFCFANKLYPAKIFTMLFGKFCKTNGLWIVILTAGIMGLQNIENIPICISTNNNKVWEHGGCYTTYFVWNFKGPFFTIKIAKPRYCTFGFLHLFLNNTLFPI